MSLSASSEIMRSRRTLLVVDDSEFVRKEVERCLLGQEFDLVLADSGEAGLEMVGLARPDLILLDFVLGDMDATQFCDRIQAEHGPDGMPPIMLVTAYHVRAQKAQRQYPFVVAYMTKPFFPDGFRADLRRTLDFIASTHAAQAVESPHAPEPESEWVEESVPEPEDTSEEIPMAENDPYASEAEPAVPAESAPLEEGAEPEPALPTGEAEDAVPQETHWEEENEPAAPRTHPLPPPRDPDSKISLNHGCYIPDGRAATLKVFIGGLLADELPWDDIRSVSRPTQNERSVVLTFAGTVLEIFTTERQELATRLMAGQVEYIAGSSEEIWLRKVE